jgi:hypothetical protein
LFLSILLTKLLKYILTPCLSHKLDVYKLISSLNKVYESYLTIKCEDKYVIKPLIFNDDLKQKFLQKYGNNLCPPEYIYSSGNNELIEDDKLYEMVESYKKTNYIL